ncbi:MAG: STAS domain-containing protein [Aquabacterium sp.]
MSAANACLTGEWTIHAIAQHRDAMLTLVNEGCCSFDAAGITEMDTAGVQLLLAAQRSIARQGQELSLLQPSGVVKDVLKAYGLDANLNPLHGQEGTP